MAQQVRVKSSDTRVEVFITDWRFLMREANKIDPMVQATFKANAREIGRPVESAVKKAIPNRRPISGMTPKVIPGRMAWGAGWPAKATELRVDTRIRKKGRSIVSVWVMSPAVAMADMAKNATSKARTKEYPYSRSPSGYRSHKLNGQGAAMIEKISASSGVKSRGPSRYTWPGAVGAMNVVNMKMLELVNNTANRLNAEILRNAK